MVSLHLDFFSLRSVVIVKLVSLASVIIQSQRKIGRNYKNVGHLRLCQILQQITTLLKH